MHYAIEPSLIPKIKADYIQGKGSLREVMETYGIEVGSEGDIGHLRMRAAKEKWTQLREQYLTSVCEERLKNKKRKAVYWEDKVETRLEKEWEVVDRSIDSIVSSEGGIDPEALANYTRTRKLQDDMMRRSLGIVDPEKRIDVTTGGKNLGESLVDALCKLRDSEDPRKVVELSEAEIEALRNAEIVVSEPGK